MIVATSRLVVRMLDESHLETLVAYRNHPEVARMQDWDLPYTVEQARERLVAQQHLTGPTPGHGVNMTIEVGGCMVGDLYCGLDDSGAIAEIGYSLIPEHQGKGYAREAANALIDHLLTTTDVHRFFGGLDPLNVPSARVLESLGMRFEGAAQLSYAMRGGWEDDVRYGMSRAQRLAWSARPHHAPTEIEFVEVTGADVHRWAALEIHHSQHRHGSTMTDVFRDTAFPPLLDGNPVDLWPRGVSADGEPVGFLLVSYPGVHHAEPVLWRLLIDRTHQGRGIGSRVVEQVRDHLAAHGHRSLLATCPSPAYGVDRFVARLGFEPTGRVLSTGTEVRLSW